MLAKESKALTRKRGPISTKMTICKRRHAVELSSKIPAFCKVTGKLAIPNIIREVKMAMRTRPSNVN